MSFLCQGDFKNIFLVEKLENFQRAKFKHWLYAGIFCFGGIVVIVFWDFDFGAPPGRVAFIDDRATGQQRGDDKKGKSHGFGLSGKTYPLK
jgi:hypothetical protein